jgi:hypothetical protein
MPNRGISLRRNSSAHTGWKGFLLGAQSRGTIRNYTFEVYLGFWVFRYIRNK